MIKLTVSGDIVDVTMGAAKHESEVTICGKGLTRMPRERRQYALALRCAARHSYVFNSTRGWTTLRRAASYCVTLRLAASFSVTLRRCPHSYAREKDEGDFLWSSGLTYLPFLDQKKKQRERERDNSVRRSDRQTDEQTDRPINWRTDTMQLQVKLICLTFIESIRKKIITICW